MAELVQYKPSSFTHGDFVFKGQKPGSVMGARMVLRRMKIEDATVHGLRDWVGECTHFGNVVAFTRGHKRSRVRGNITRAATISKIGIASGQLSSMFAQCQNSITSPAITPTTMSIQWIDVASRPVVA
jgi:hypothetical protein